MELRDDSKPVRSRSGVPVHARVVFRLRHPAPRSLCSSRPLSERAQRPKKLELRCGRVRGWSCHCSPGRVPERGVRRPVEQRRQCRPEQAGLFLPDRLPPRPVDQFPQFLPNFVVPTGFKQAGGWGGGFASEGAPREGQAGARRVATGDSARRAVHSTLLFRPRLVRRAGQPSAAQFWGRRARPGLAQHGKLGADATLWLPIRKRSGDGILKLSEMARPAAKLSRRKNCRKSTQQPSKSIEGLRCKPAIW